MHTYIHRDCSSCDQATEHIAPSDPTKMERLPCPTNDSLSTYRDRKAVPVLSVEGDEDTEGV